MTERNDTKKKMLKEMIRELHSGVPPQQVKEKFREALANISSLEISQIEQELVQEGMPREEIHRLCEVHMLVFQEQLESQKLEIPAENPVSILQEEHKIMLQLTEMLKIIAKSVHQASGITDVTDDIAHLKHVKDDLLDSEKHYLREENVLFPTLEKHGVTEPPAIMWTEHNRIREEKKKFFTLVDDYSAIDFQDFKTKLTEAADVLSELLSSHFFKENNILFPTAMKVVTDEEWMKIRREFDNIGYCRFTPQHLIRPTAQSGRMEEEKPEPMHMPTELLQFDTGEFSKAQIESIMKTLPFDVTFVDKDDIVRYFNKSEIFLRTESVIGRKVQQCHPQKSVHIVNQILESFKTGKKDVAEFWIPMDNGARLIHIRYFTVRDKDRNYVGTMEVTQDITGIKKIEGEKRLLDWKD